MELTIKKRFSVVAVVLYNKIIINLGLLLLGTFAMLIYVTTVTDYSPAVAILLILVLPILHCLYLVVDALIFASKTRMELKDNGVDLHTGNVFTSTNFTFTFNQINSLSSNQTFIFKLLGVSSISISTTDGVTTGVWGFNNSESVKFLEEFNKAQKVRVSSN